MKIKPTRSNIAVQIDKEPQKTKAGIFITNEESEENPTRGKVIAIGSTVKRIAVGDIVVFPAFSGISIELEEEEIILMDSETSVFAVLED